MTTFDRCREALTRGGFLVALARLAAREQVVFLALETAKAVARLAAIGLVSVGLANLIG